MWLSVVLVVLAICGLITVRRRRVPEGKLPPEYPGALPFIGHGHLFWNLPLFELNNDIVKASALWGGVIGFRPGLNQAYMISDPEDSLTIANVCLEKNFVYGFMKPALGKGLLTANLSIWQTHRKLLAPAFNQVILDGFIGVFNAQGKKLIAALHKHTDGIPFDCQEPIDRSALETICLTAMGGANAKELLNNKYLDARERVHDILIERYQKFWLHSDLMFNLSSQNKSFTEANKIIHEGSSLVIKKKRAEFYEKASIVSEKSGRKFKTFIDLVMEDYGAKGVLTDTEIRDEVDTMIMAGHETTSITLMFTLILLGSHPEVQELVFKEISEVLDERDVEKQDLSKLVYLEAVLKESMRLYPIAAFIARKLTYDIKLKNYTLLAGSSVYIAICALHRNEAWGADAEQFAPARWLEKRLPEHASAFMPFSIGRRNCIGQTYAMMSMKIVLVHLVRSFRFTSDVSKLRVKLDILLKPVSGREISIQVRE